jgi:molecular chaperone DnaJ
MATRDYYRILGVSPKSPWDEVRRRFRLLAQEHHPDRNPDDPEAAARFRLVVEAYEAIQACRAKPKRGAGNYRTPQFNGNEDFFAEFFGISSGVRKFKSAGANFRYDLEIPLYAAIKGTETVISVDHNASCLRCHGTGLALGATYQPCPQCQGRGRRYGGPGLLRFGPFCDRCRGRGKIVAQACHHCGGHGQLREKREYRLRIPPGTEDGARLHFRGEGGEGFQEGPPGNLEVVIQVAPDDFFSRVGNDLYCQIKVSFALAALGGIIRIRTLDGFQEVKLPKGTQTGWVFRVQGAGAPAGPGRAPGDQVNEVVVTTPLNLSPRQKELLEEWNQLEQEEVRKVGHE